MEKLKFRMFTWPENPEHFSIAAIREPRYIVNADGSLTYQELGPLCRVISGRGVFCGTDAVDDFNALAVIMATGTLGELVHPVWGTMNAYFTELTLEQESREDYVVYSFVFREANEDGSIPALPDTEETE